MVYQPYEIFILITIIATIVTSMPACISIYEQGFRQLSTGEKTVVGIFLVCGSLMTSSVLILALLSFLTG